MARNVEIKAHIESVESLSPNAAAIATDDPVTIEQDETRAAKCSRLLPPTNGETPTLGRGTPSPRGVVFAP
jgi:hypothetical protein